MNELDPWSRRRFLAGSAAALGGLSGTLAGCPAPSAPGFAEPSVTPGPWGDPANAEQAAVLLPESLRSEGTLEWFLSGGVSAFENFVVVPELGMSDTTGPQQWWLFQEGPGSIPERFAACGGTGELLTSFGTDDEGRSVFLGPWVRALAARPDIVSRMRIVVMRHNQVAHQGANPLALTGLTLGQPRMAGTAAHVQRFHASHQTQRTLPWSHVLLPRGRSVEINNSDAGASVGLHPGAARPLITWLGEAQPLSQQLRREHLLAGSDAHDQLLELWGRRMRDRLRYPVGGASSRAPALDDYEFARSSLANHNALADLLPASALALGSGQSCGQTGDEDMTTTALQLAIHLLREGDARYVLAMDGGLIEANGMLGFDTHTDHVADSSRNLSWSMQQLAASINTPGENEVGKLDLDRHTIVLTSEFGRTPYRQGGNGTDHWPQGYAHVIIGGVVGTGQAGVVGALDETGLASSYTSPAEFRAAMLLAQGIWPFQPDAFGVGDMREGDTEVEAARILRARVLGRPT